MAFYDKFPYTNFQEINLDKLVIKMLQLELEQKEFINNNVIKYADPISWNITKQYEANTVVTDEAGNAYISSQPVPAGVSINNQEYWSKIGNFDQLWTDIKKAITPADEGSGTTATAARAVNDLVWMSNTLYIVTAPMIAGDSYVVGSNCEVTDIDTELKKIIAVTAENADDIAAEIVNRENADNALTNYINQKIQNLPEFPTPEAFGAVGDGVADDTAAFNALLAYCKQNNLKCFIPNNTYQLNKNILFDNSLILNNGGTYPNKKLFTNGSGDIADFETTFKQFAISISDLVGSYSGYALQACCENPVTGNIVIGMYNGTSQLGMLVEVTTAFSVVKRVVGDFGHINDMCFNTDTQTLFIAPGTQGNNANMLIEVNPSSLAITNTYDLDYPNTPKWHVAFDKDSHTLVASSYSYQWFIDSKDLTVFDVTNVTYIDGKYINEAMQNSIIEDGKLYTLSFADWAFFNWYWTCYNFAEETTDHIQPWQGTNNGMEYEGCYILNNQRYMLASDGTDVYQFNVFNKKKVTGYIVENLNKAGYVLSTENIDDLRGTGVYACLNATVAAALSGSVPFKSSRGFRLEVYQTGWRATKQVASVIDGYEEERHYNPDDGTWSTWKLRSPIFVAYGLVNVAANSYADVTITLPTQFSTIQGVFPRLFSTSANAAYGGLCAVEAGSTSSTVTVRVYNNTSSSFAPSLSVMIC